MFLRIIMTAFLLGSLSFELYAQNSVTLNVNLYPIQTLLVNTAQKEVNLEYSTREDYRNGVVSEQQDHLIIYSTGGFQVKVSAVTAAIDNSKQIYLARLVVSTFVYKKLQIQDFQAVK